MSIPMLVWTLVYDHEDCDACKERVDSALAHARATGSLGCHAQTTDFNGNTHGARVTRGPIKIEGFEPFTPAEGGFFRRNRPDTDRDRHSTQGYKSRGH